MKSSAIVAAVFVLGASLARSPQPATAGVVSAGALAGSQMPTATAARLHDVGYHRGWRGGHWRHGGWGHRGWGYHRGWGHRGWGHRGWGYNRGWGYGGAWRGGWYHGGPSGRRGWY